MSLVSTALVASFFSFFFNDTATTEIYTLSLHDALPIWKFSTSVVCCSRPPHIHPSMRSEEHTSELQSRGLISYAVFCLKKKTHPHPIRQPDGFTPSLLRGLASSTA